MALLPGQVMWPGGVSSFVFGINDTYHFWAGLSAPNMGNDFTVADALRKARVSLMRMWAFNSSQAIPTSDSELDLRIAICKAAGCTPLCCIADIATAADQTYAQHVVTYLGSRCNMYEVGNEFDSTSGQNDAHFVRYIPIWNSIIPTLRTINPNAKFFGPTAANWPYIQDFLTGVNTSGVLPDAITYHLYPCAANNDADVVAGAPCYNTDVLQFGSSLSTIRGQITTTLGISLPVGITEWNYSFRSPPVIQGQNSTFRAAFATNALANMITNNLDFACYFSAYNDAGQGDLDMFDTKFGAPGRPKAEYDALLQTIAQYHPDNYRQNHRIEKFA